MALNLISANSIAAVAYYSASNDVINVLLK